MNAKKRSSSRKKPGVGNAAKKPKRGVKIAHLARGALLAVGLTAAQLSAEADFFGDKVFSHNLVDRLHSTSLTHYHE